MRPRPLVNMGALDAPTDRLPPGLYGAGAYFGMSSSRSDGQVQYRPRPFDALVPPPPSIRAPTYPALTVAQTAPSRSATEAKADGARARKQPTAKLSDCCTAASIKTPRNSQLVTQEIYNDLQLGGQHWKDFHNLLTGSKQTRRNGPGLSTSGEEPAHSIRNGYLAGPEPRVIHPPRPPIIAKKVVVPPSDGRSTSISLRRPTVDARPLMAVTTFAHPYQQAGSATNNSALSLCDGLDGVHSPASSPYPQLEAAPQLSGLAGNPGNSTMPLIQRRTRKPLELGLFQSQAEPVDATQLARVIPGKRLQGSTSMPLMAATLRSPGSLRPPPPFPPPQMPLPAIPLGETYAPSPRTGPVSRGASLDNPVLYGKHSPITSSANLATPIHGRSRSSSLDSPANSTIRAKQHQMSDTGNKALQLVNSAGTFTPVQASSIKPSGTNQARTVEKTPQPQLKALELETGTSLSQAYPSPRSRSNAHVPQPDVHPQLRANLDHRAQTPGTPPTSPSGHKSSLSRTDSHGRRLSISMLPYTNEPSWSVSGPASPPPLQREGSITERSSPRKRSSSNSLRYMAALISSGSPRPPHERGHGPQNSGASAARSASLSSRETSPMLPMHTSSSHAGSSASSASFDGPMTPAESISERFNHVDVVSSSRRSASVPRILFLGSQEVPAGLEHLVRSAAETGDVRLAPSRPIQLDTSRAMSPQDGVPLSRTPSNLSPVPGSSPGSQDTHTSTVVAANGHSARSSVVITSHDFLAIPRPPSPSRKAHRDARYFVAYPDWTDWGSRALPAPLPPSPAPAPLSAAQSHLQPTRGRVASVVEQFQGSRCPQPQPLAHSLDGHATPRAQPQQVAAHHASTPLWRGDGSISKKHGRDDEVEYGMAL